MKMLVIQRGGFSVTELSGVSRVNYSAGVVTIVHSGGTSTFAYGEYIFQFIV